MFHYPFGTFSICTCFPLLHKNSSRCLFLMNDNSYNMVLHASISYNHQSAEAPFLMGPLCPPQKKLGEEKKRKGILMAAPLLQIIPITIFGQIWICESYLFYLPNSREWDYSSYISLHLLFCQVYLILLVSIFTLKAW